MSQPQLEENDGEDATRGDDEDHARHHRARRRLPDRGSARARAQSLAASGGSDQEAIDGGLAEPTPEVRRRHRLESLREIELGRDAEHTDADDTAAENADDVGVDGQK